MAKPVKRTEGSPGLNGTFVQPFNGQVDFSSLLNYEDWDAQRRGGSAPESLWYFSGAMSDELPTPDFTDHDFPARQHQRVKHQAIQFLQATTGYLWHKTHATWSPMALDFQNLWSPDPTEKGLARFEHQFWRANIDPSERYVLACAGSTRHRLRADGGGIANLALAGDWIYNGLNLGSVEGAVMGGMLAADAVQEKPVIGLQVIGYPPDQPAGPAAGSTVQAQ